MIMIAVRLVEVDRCFQFAYNLHTHDRIVASQHVKARVPFHNPLIESPSQKKSCYQNSVDVSVRSACYKRRFLCLSRRTWLQVLRFSIELVVLRVLGKQYQGP